MSRNGDGGDTRGLCFVFAFFCALAAQGGWHDGGKWLLIPCAWFLLGGLCP